LAAGLEQAARARQGAARHLRQVVSGAASRALTAQDDDGHRRIGRRFGKGGDEIVEERVRERVAALRAVEHERAQTGCVLDQERGSGDGGHVPRIPPYTASSAWGVGSKR